MEDLVLSRVLGLLSLKVKITGAARDGVLAIGDLLYPRLRTRGLMRVPVGPATLEVDTSHCSQRLLCYAPLNILMAYEKSGLFSVMAKYLSPGATFVDVGANLGIYGLLAKTRFQAKVVSFEPEAAHFDFLKRNAHVFDETYPFALGDREGESAFYVAGDANPGASSLVESTRPEGNPVYVGRTTVHVRRFDDVLGQGVDIGLVKIDVEGAEAAVVRGMERSFQAGQRPPIWCEVRGPSSDRNPNSFREVCDFLKTFGYAASVGLEARPFDPCEGAARVFDLLFVAEDR